MNKEICRIEVETAEYYRKLDENDRGDWESFWDEDLEMEKYYETKYPKK